LKEDVSTLQLHIVTSGSQPEELYPVGPPLSIQKSFITPHFRLIRNAAIFLTEAGKKKILAEIPCLL
jgi:hypothetical protein